MFKKCERKLGGQHNHTGDWWITKERAPESIPVAAVDEKQRGSGEVSTQGAEHG